jgi:hypothetical protein
LPKAEHLPRLVERYLAAFGPASVNDMQTWSYLENLKPVFSRLELHAYRDERGRELFDLPRLSIAAADAAAPVRFVPEYDNLLLAHQHRARIVAQVHRKRVFLPGLRVAATLLVDGFVAGTWTTSRVKDEATLHVQAFETLPRRVSREVEEEGERLLRFVEPAASTFSVRIDDR